MHRRLFFPAAAMCVAIIFAAVEPAAAQTALRPVQPPVRAPSIDGGTAWLNTAEPLRLEKLRGKFVILEFWTYCCINCIHQIADLKKLERAYPESLVVIGIHAAKFKQERELQNVREAVLRYEINHPVVNDGSYKISQRYKANVWPTLIVIDPEGFVVAGQTGEVRFAALDTFLKRAIPRYRGRGTLQTSPLPLRPEQDHHSSSPLKFPGKVLADEATRRLFIADSNHNRIVICTMDGTVTGTIGSEKIGRADGDFSSASFFHPQGLALHGNTLYIADTENHLIRMADLKHRKVVTLAGTGRQAGLRPKSTSRDLNSPWDLCVHQNSLYIAMAGAHQVWSMPLGGRRPAVFAGSGSEDLIDGPLRGSPSNKKVSAFAQPSGFATADQRLYVADSEASAIRAVPFHSRQSVRTVLGPVDRSEDRLFTFGDRDGPVKTALLQHPLGIAHHDHHIYIADTYNNKIKELNLAEMTIRTVAGDGRAGGTDKPARFNEPAGLSIANGRLYVADTNNHTIRVIELDNDYKVSTLKLSSLPDP
ncbi:MAG: thioredoxin-like domain-containing protein [Pirellulales bacterium]